MPLETKINMHKINDFIIESPDLFTHAEARVAYFCMNLAYGANKATFFAGATYIAERLGCSRDAVYATWEKLQRMGWIADTGERKGRATVWRIDYRKAWNDYVMSSQSTLSSIQSTVSVEPVDTNVDSTRTNPPKEASELNPPKESTRNATSISSKPGRAVVQGGREEEGTANPSSGRVQGKMKRRTAARDILADLADMDRHANGWW